MIRSINITEHIGAENSGMSNLEELLRARTAARGWLKRGILKVEQVIDAKGRCD